MTGSDTERRIRVSPAKRTDLGNAQRLVARYLEVVRYVQATDRWHVWDGTRWAPDETGAIDRLARDTVRAMQREAAAMPSDTEEQSEAKIEAAKWAVACEGAARLASMIQLARYEEGVPVTATAFDGRPWELNCPNGVVDLKTGKLLNHDPAHMHSQRAAVRFIEGAKAPAWRRFLRVVLPDAEVRRYIQRLLGASLVGQPLPAATFPFIFGEGGTGKSTLLEPVLHALGDYGRLAPANLLTAKRGGGGDQTYDIAALRGARFVLASEGHSRQQLAEDVVKRITGDTTLAGRQIREAELTFPNVTALWFMSNHEPRVSSTDTGLWRRIREIPMDVVLSPRYAGLKERLIEEELEGILAWCVSGCVDYQRNGLKTPAAVTAATDSYRDDSNPLLEWAEQALVRDPDARETGPDLHASYVDWCATSRRRNDYPSGRSKVWARALKSLELEPVRTTAWRGYSGAALRQPPL